MREQHTAGPWSVDPISNWITAQDAKGLFHVADVRGWGHLTGKGHGAWGYPEDKAVSIQMANACLIAAAPDLLAALKAIHKAIVEQDIKFGPLTYDAAAAIAKAEGAAVR